MKRRDLLRYLAEHDCVQVREGANHTVFLNPASGRISTVPRHREINPGLARKICQDLGVPHPPQLLRETLARYDASGVSVAEEDREA